MTLESVESTGQIDRKSEKNKKLSDNHLDFESQEVYMKSK